MRFANGNDLQMVSYNSTNSTNGAAHNKYQYAICYTIDCRTSFKEEMQEDISPLHVEFPISFSPNLRVCH
jgi:hypothetical protein